MNQPPTERVNVAAMEWMLRWLPIEEVDRKHEPKDVHGCRKPSIDIFHKPRVPDEWLPTKTISYNVDNDNDVPPNVDGSDKQIVGRHDTLLSWRHEIEHCKTTVDNTYNRHETFACVLVI